MSLSSAALRVLMEGDFRCFRRNWADLFPHFASEAPKTDTDAEFSLHYARTLTNAVPLGMRQYSHDWLIDHGYPSGLPEELQPKRLDEGVIVLGVGISVNGNAPEVNDIIRGSMENAVLDADADGRLADAEFVRARMQEARRRTVRELFGSVSIPKLEGMKK
jgi:hypothetical protein